MTAPPSPDSHVSSNTLAAYIDGRLDPAGRAAVVEHLADCAECRRELVDARRALQPPAGHRVVWIGTAAAAAALGLLLVRPPATLIPRGQHDVLREEGSVTASAPLPIVPTGDVSDASRIVWSAVPTANRYRVTLFDAHGSMLWEVETRDTTATLPGTVRLAPDSTYVWTVSARIAFDRWATSALEAFTLRRIR